MKCYILNFEHRRLFFNEGVNGKAKNVFFLFKGIINKSEIKIIAGKIEPDIL